VTESNYNYAFIAGRDPRNDRPAAPKPPASELDTLVEAIAVMANWRRRGPYQCSVLYQANGRLQQFELQVWPGGAVVPLREQGDRYRGLVRRRDRCVYFWE
jgi:hypothetical protein